jgi:hypothetical protein
VITVDPPRSASKDVLSEQVLPIVPEPVVVHENGMVSGS